MEKILVTGAAGFIGFHSAIKLLEEGHELWGIDNLNDYYDVRLKHARIESLKSYPNFHFRQVDISDFEALKQVMGRTRITRILHLAAQAGVRYSIENPRVYINSNVMGHLNILEYARYSDSLERLAYASSSSVYGDRESGPFSETDKVRNPVSLYAATKLSGEMLAQSYYNLYKIPQTGLRFFTVYGPWGRPDMAYFIFTNKILNDEPITLFAPEEMRRDFTYIDDIVNIIPTILETPLQAGHAIYNLGNSTPNTLMQLVDCVETACDKTAKKIIQGKQKGDVSSTYADTSAAQRDFGFNAKTNLEVGIPKFVDWYKAFYQV